MQGPPPYGQPPYGQQYPQQPQQQWQQQQQQWQGQQPPMMQQPPMPQATMRRPDAVKLGGGLYVTFYVVCLVATGFLSGLASNRATVEAAPFVPLPILVWSIMQMVLTYKMWAAINDGVTKPTPGAALGFLFIPFFSLYWIFVVWPGYATQYNAFVKRHNIAAPPLSQGFILCAMLLCWVPIVGIVLWAMNISRVCRAVNALSAPAGGMMAAPMGGPMYGVPQGMQGMHGPPPGSPPRY